jgi:Na+(H+)/acetate symporter ActP
VFRGNTVFLCCCGADIQMVVFATSLRDVGSYNYKEVVSPRLGSSYVKCVFAIYAVTYDVDDPNGMI